MTLRGEDGCAVKGEEVLVGMNSGSMKCASVLVRTYIDLKQTKKATGIS